MSDKYCSKCRSKLSECPTCHGKGTTYQGGGLLTSGSQKPCPNCKGIGGICAKCRGA